MTKVYLFTIPYGDAGIRRTLRKMRQLVRASLTDPLTVETATRILSTYDRPCDFVWAIRAFLAGTVRFVPDPTGVELVKTPRYMLREILERGQAEGDCDDVAVLGAALGMAVGLQARFRVLGFDPGGPFAHVFAELQTPGGWQDLDTTAPAQMPAGLTIHRELVEGV